MNEQTGRDKFLEAVPATFLEAPQEPHVPADFLEAVKAAKSQPPAEQSLGLAEWWSGRTENGGE